jgi:hypothetical protein
MISTNIVAFLPAGPSLQGRLAHLRSQRLEPGGWNLTPKTGSNDITTCRKAFRGSQNLLLRRERIRRPFVFQQHLWLRISSVPPDSPHFRQVAIFFGRPLTGFTATAAVSLRDTEMRSARRRISSGVW